MQRKGFRVIFESYNLDSSEQVFDREVLIDDVINPANDCLDFSMPHEQQIKLIQATQDKLLAEKTQWFNQEQTTCPECSGKLSRRGKRTSKFHDVFTDHEVTIQRLICTQCGHEMPSTLKSLLNSSLSGALIKIQSELGANQTFRSSEKLLETFSTQQRAVNNHNRIKVVTEKVGQSLGEVEQKKNELLSVDNAPELVVSVDGGHVKTTEDQRSIEALAAIVYRPESLLSNPKDTRHYLSDKSCAASVKEDGQKEIINETILAALKQGLTPETHITALCDGASNCWNVIEGLRPLCKGITCILDWFHIAMKMQNIALPKTEKSQFLRIKWHLWRGNTEAAIYRLDTLIASAKTSSLSGKLTHFKQYIQNNISRIVNYRKRFKAGLVFTSNLAECTVESLINQRCKGQQHMRWSREGLNPILQLRARIHSNEWNDNWRTVVLNSAK